MADKVYGENAVKTCNGEQKVRMLIGPFINVIVMKVIATI
jgi:hypothetical protein